MDIEPSTKPLAEKRVSLYSLDEMEYTTRTSISESISLKQVPLLTREEPLTQISVTTKTPRNEKKTHSPNTTPNRTPKRQSQQQHEQKHNLQIHLSFDCCTFDRRSTKIVVSSFKFIKGTGRGREEHERTSRSS